MELWGDISNPKYCTLVLGFADPKSHQCFIKFYSEVKVFLHTQPANIFISVACGTRLS